MAETERIILTVLILLFLLVLGLIFGPNISKRNSQSSKSKSSDTESTSDTAGSSTSPDVTTPRSRDPRSEPTNRFEFFEDFRVFRSFMNERKSQDLDMGPLSSSSAFSNAYYSGNISLDHSPLEVVEKIVSLYREDRSLQNVLNLENEDVSEREALNEVQSTLSLYEKIENREFL